MLAKEGKDNTEVVNQVKALKEDISKIQQDLDKAQDEFNNLILQVPNVLAEDVPTGADDNENVVIATV
jgi:seryl-tRNA synthetase